MLALEVIEDLLELLYGLCGFFGWQHATIDFHAALVRNHVGHSTAFDDAYVQCALPKQRMFFTSSYLLVEDLKALDDEHHVFDRIVSKPRARAVGGDPPRRDFDIEAALRRNLHLQAGWLGN